MKISVVVNAHREGYLLTSAMRSVALNFESAGQARIECECVIILDNPDAATCTAAEVYTDFAKIVKVTVGDLSAARNIGVESTDSDMVAFLDADDLWCSDWLIKSAGVIETSPKTIAHPEINMYFASGRRKREVFVHCNSTDRVFSPDLFRFVNVWTSLSAASREAYEHFPYVSLDLQNGWGFEDWKWNADTLAAGYDHVAVPQTAHFIRRKDVGSLLAVTNRSSTWVRPSPFFEYSTQSHWSNNAHSRFSMEEE